MEGIGSRTGRPSSRYGSAPVFTGPVRRWQKQWVHVSSSSSVVSYNHSNRSNSNSTSNSNSNNISDVRIRRWTPVPAAHSAGDSEPVVEERPRRKLRYAPASQKRVAATKDLNDQPMELEVGDDDDDEDHDLGGAFCRCVWLLKDQKNESKNPLTRTRVFKVAFVSAGRVGVAFWEGIRTKLHPPCARVGARVKHDKGT
ncbi:hypothetical protein QVD17_27156 [Tagetes erecta]|uniref:Uncharacterized protein n=1 Tax=Tagetes erecta TaxID=13708 RepID=A0AAD8NJ49_TARER|nr:hypothetical protein QVD17_27156 [Tagetes erecta]